MRKPIRLLLVWSALITACKSDGATNPGDTGGPPVTTSLTCSQPGGQSAECGLALPAAGGFSLALLGTACDATDNTLAVTSPVSQTLTSDICHTAAGATWSFPGPYDAGTELRLQVTSRRFPNPPSLRATQVSATEWMITFEDGFDSDFDDMKLQVDAVTGP